MSKTFTRVKNVLYVAFLALGCMLPLGWAGGVQGQIVVQKAVYGGANQAATTGSTTVKMLNGTVSEVYGGSKGLYESENKVSADVNGNVEVNMTGGTVGTVFGGSNVNGNITGTITVNIDSTVADFDVDFVYGGGNLTGYTPTAGTSTQSPVVNVKSGTVNRAVFGGGMGDAERGTEQVHATPYVTVGNDGDKPVRVGNDHTLQSNAEGEPFSIGKDTDHAGEGYVFGGGNVMGTDGGTLVVVKGAKTFVKHSVYGGGNQAEVKGNTEVRIGDEAAE